MFNSVIYYPVLFLNPYLIRISQLDSSWAFPDDGRQRCCAFKRPHTPHQEFPPPRSPLSSPPQVLAAILGRSIAIDGVTLTDRSRCPPSSSRYSTRA